MWAPWETGLCHLSFYLWKCPMQFFTSGVQGIRMSRGPFQEPFLPQRTARLCSSVTKEEEWLWKLSVPITFSISERPQSSFPGWDPISPQSKAIFFSLIPAAVSRWADSGRLGWEFVFLVMSRSLCYQTRGLGGCSSCLLCVSLEPRAKTFFMKKRKHVTFTWHLLGFRHFPSSLLMASHLIFPASLM